MAAENMDVFMGDLEPLTKDPKATEDLEEAASAAIASAELLALDNQSLEAVEILLPIEKKARQACDAASASRICRKILEICKESGDWPGVNTNLIALSKRHGQLKRVIIDIVELGVAWLDDTPTEDIRLSLIETLSQVTSGKIFVEVQRARLMRRLAAIKEAEGKIDEAANILENVQVETFGAMERIEKTTFILEQMRLVLAKEDYIRCQIISKKINPKLLEGADSENLKIQFYKHMICYYLHENEFLDVAKSYQAIYSTPGVQQDETQWKQYLESFVGYLVISPYSNEKTDLLNRIAKFETRQLSQLQHWLTLVEQLLTMRLIHWPMQNGTDLRQSVFFTSAMAVSGDELWEYLRVRVIQHNIKTLEKYYSQIRMPRVCDFLRVDMEEAEKHISDLVVSGYLCAKVDRPAQVVTFTSKKESAEKLNMWSRDLAKVLALVDQSCHLVEKERMIQAAKQQRIQ